MNTQLVSISEAFSMQPKTLKVGENMGTFKDPKVVTRIVMEIRPNHADVYVGYNKNDVKLFEYIVTAVNVHYV